MEAFNIKFVGEVEKHPPLYNYTIPDYCRKDLVDKAWHAVSTEVKIPGKYYIFYTYAFVYGTYVFFVYFMIHTS